MPEAAPPADQPKGLPPVVPPTGKYIAQLFLVPGLIVTVALILLLSFKWLFGDPTDPVKLLHRLDSGNAAIRERAANDLAQVLLRDDRLAANPKFALDLADRLRLAQQSSREVVVMSGGTMMVGRSETTSLLDDHNFAAYLAACLGNCSLPVGAPLLCVAATKQGSPGSETASLQRRQAVWALANLGENIKRFDRLPVEAQAAAVTALDGEAGGEGPRAETARLVRGFLEVRAAGHPTALGVDVALEKCAADPDPFVRELAAFALNFWEGNSSENTRMEQTLVRLLHDDGHGAADASARGGLTIRYNAAVALARRGSDRAPLELLRDMLDADAQLKFFVVKRKDGSEVPDEAAARMATINALKAVADLHRRRPQRDLSSLQPAIDALLSHANPVLRVEAERTRLLLNKK
jgi:hypothetical protein